MLKKKDLHIWNVCDSARQIMCVRLSNNLSLCNAKLHNCAQFVWSWGLRCLFENKLIFPSSRVVPCAGRQRYQNFHGTAYVVSPWNICSKDDCILNCDSTIASLIFFEICQVSPGCFVFLFFSCWSVFCTMSRRTQPHTLMWDFKNNCTLEQYFSKMQVSNLTK